MVLNIFTKYCILYKIICVGCILEGKNLFDITYLILFVKYMIHQKVCIQQLGSFMF